MQESVKQLTTAIASGDSEAFARFFRMKFDDMYAMARRASGRDESFCLDVVQDAMIRVIRSLRPMDTDAGLHNWLRVVVQSCAYDRLRRERRRMDREAAVGPKRDGSWNAVASCEQLEWLRAQLRESRDPHLKLLLLRHRLGWTLHRISAVFGMKPGAVDGRIRRSLENLRRRAKESLND